MKTFARGMFALCLAILIVGCSEEPKKPMSKTGANGNGNGAATNGLDNAKEKAHEASARAGEAAAEAGEAAAKAGEAAAKASEAAAKAGEEASKAAVETVDQIGEKAGEAIDAIGKEFSAAKDKAKTALADVEGGSDVLKKITDLFASAKESLMNVKDSETAKAAQAKLDELDGKVDEIAAKLKTLPEGTRKTVSDVIAKGSEHLRALGDKIAATYPDAAETIKSKLDALRDKLENLKQ